ncbi:hypothetical protein PV10_05779 [Exophiala mesophila]|uniref:Uncharacterized protein n=1 Tax=Exophiala mesophila TaxID=212818 RepID=A0A0D1Z908_EXOME|nr:uncharacterized protein PV10_05779 [Exophiala mesophila]KIV91217.1 hypothetical protein PV10_05779 [Exophiala mesophila]
MSSSNSVHSQKMDTRFSTPAPELDDHRRPRNTNPASAMVPSVEVHPSTPAPSGLDEKDIEHINAKLLHSKDQEPITRDFEHAILSDDERSDGEPESARRISNRRPTNRDGRPRVQRQERQDRSRDTSSSRSTSPANSVEAFAEPRRRHRANTADSHSSSIIENLLRRTQSGGTNQRRPTLSNISVPGPPTHRTDRAYDDDVTFEPDEEPGKTYKIDYEELEEYVALVAQGKIEDDTPHHGSGRVFNDLRRKKTNESTQSLPNIALNGDNFYEKPLTTYETGTTDSSSEEKPNLKEKFPVLPPSERFYLFSSELPQGQTATKLGDFVSDGTTFRDLFDIGPDGGVWWLDVLNPTPSELSVLAKAFKIHRLTAEDIETQEAREKVELFPQYYFVCFRTFNPDHSSEDFLDPIHVYIVVTSDGVLSFSYTPNPHARNVRKRIAKLPDFESLGPDYICYAMIDDIVDSFAPPIRGAERESEAIEDQVFVAREDNYVALLRQIGECRKRVLNMMRLLGGKADVIKGFAKRCNDQYNMMPRGDIGLYLGDIQDHVVTMMSNLGHVEKMLSRSHANYLAQLNVDSILKGNTTNKALTKITVVATILVPLNLITGLFGMNVTIPGENQGTLYWFFGIIGGIICFVAFCLFMARRLRAI